MTDAHLPAARRASVNNRFYEELGERWLSDDTHAIALLRVEAAIKLQYLEEVFAARGVPVSARVLDIACGAGLISIPLAAKGYRTKGVDLSPSSIAMASRNSPEGAPLSFAVADAYALSEPDESYDVVLLFDCLEHVDRPSEMVREAARVLRPGGLLFFHTFNRTWLAYLVIIKGAPLLVREYPDCLHVYRCFVKPSELQDMCRRSDLETLGLRGLRPNFFSTGFWRSLMRKKVLDDFTFSYTRSLALGYIGYAEKRRRDGRAS